MEDHRRTVEEQRRATDTEPCPPPAMDGDTVPIPQAQIDANIAAVMEDC